MTNTNQNHITISMNVYISSALRKRFRTLLFLFLDFRKCFSSLNKLGILISDRDDYREIFRLDDNVDTHFTGELGSFRVLMKNIWVIF